jgi:DNA-binding NtrC family response regulator
LRNTRTTIDVSTVAEIAARPTLLVMSQETFTTVPLVADGEMVIGRSGSCEIHLDDPLASRRHARLHLGEAPAIEDLGSINGTRVRDALIEPRTRVAIAPGETIAIGSTMMVLQTAGQAAVLRGTWSHDYFERRLQTECVRAESTGRRFALARLRLERPSSWTRVVPVLARHLPPPHLFGAYGPNDFELLLLDQSAEDVQRLLDDIALSLRVAEAPARFGLAWYPRDGRSADALLDRANALLRAAGSRPDPLPAEAVGPGMERVYDFARRAAPTNISVLLLGETGVGKELLAQAIHRLSSRATKPMLALNCAGLSESIIEAELFGHEKGAYTGAGEANRGLLESADGGTVFLDEVGEMPASIQAKLLRVIETREVLPVGARKVRSIDVRFLAATNRNLEEEADKGSFRRDLFYRLNGMSIVIPPLRERRFEIEALARKFVEAAAQESGRETVPSISPAALAALQAYDWPGNVRELKNMIERALVLCDGPQIEVAHLPAEKLAVPDLPGPTPPAGAPARPLSPEEQLEKLKMIATLDGCAWNQSRAAEQMSMSRRTFVAKMSRYAIPRPNRTRAAAARAEESDLTSQK